MAKDDRRLGRNPPAVPPYTPVVPIARPAPASTRTVYVQVPAPAQPIIIVRQGNGAAAAAFVLGVITCGMLPIPLLSLLCMPLATIGLFLSLVGLFVAAVRRGSAGWAIGGLLLNGAMFAFLLDGCIAMTSDHSARADATSLLRTRPHIAQAEPGANARHAAAPIADVQDDPPTAKTPAEPEIPPGHIRVRHPWRPKQPKP